MIFPKKAIYCLVERRKIKVSMGADRKQRGRSKAQQKLKKLALEKGEEDALYH